MKKLILLLVFGCAYTADPSTLLRHPYCEALSPTSQRCHDDHGVWRCDDRGGRWTCIPTPRYWR